MHITLVRAKIHLYQVFNLTGNKKPHKYGIYGGLIREMRDELFQCFIKQTILTFLIFVFQTTTTTTNYHYDLNLACNSFILA